MSRRYFGEGKYEIPSWAVPFALSHTKERERRIAAMEKILLFFTVLGMIGLLGLFNAC